MTSTAVSVQVPRAAEEAKWLEFYDRTNSNRQSEDRIKVGMKLADGTYNPAFGRNLTIGCIQALKALWHQVSSDSNFPPPDSAMSTLGGTLTVEALHALVEMRNLACKTGSQGEIQSVKDRTLHECNVDAKGGETVSHGGNVYTRSSQDVLTGGHYLIRTADGS